MSEQDIQKPKLLTVDDELNILKSLKRTLRKCDLDVHIASSGKEALEIMETEQFDVIISDMRMPEMTGAEFLKEARERQPDAKRILLTGYSDIQSTVDAINQGGISTYLAKPWDDAQLIRVVEEAVEFKRLLARNETLEEVTRQQNEELKALNAGLEEKVQERTLEIENASIMLRQAINELTGSYETMVSLLATTTALRDKTGSAYSDEKLALGLAIADLVPIEGDDRKSLEQAILLHRIGMLSLPDEVMATPYKSLSKSQRQEFDQHPIYAEATVMGVPQLNDAALLIRHQNEKWDGTGFPDKKVKSSIPLGSRIIAIARDYYDLISGLYQSRKIDPKSALARIQSESGERYDPGLVLLLEKALNSHDSMEEGLDVVDLQVAQLRPGMCLAKDLKSLEGLMLLKRDQVLTEALIEKITNLVSNSGPNLLVRVKAG